MLLDNKVVIRPGWLGALAIWLGSDHYGFSKVLMKAPFQMPKENLKLYQIQWRNFWGGGLNTRFAVEYSSSRRDCLITLAEKPNVPDIIAEEISPMAFFAHYINRMWAEPTAIVIPMLLPIIFPLFILLFAVWDQLVLHNSEILSFFVNPGCDAGCVRKVLSVHSLVGFLFITQFIFLALPMVLLFFHAPKYKSAISYRMIQSYSMAGIILGIFVSVQLLAFFPFKQYGRFLEMGFSSKVERLFAHSKDKKN